MRGMCQLPYPNHPKGCPNYNKKNSCPPNCQIFNLQPPYYAIINEFDLASHVARMYELHPKWTERQAYCCLYWQPKARKKLKEEIILFKRQNPALSVNTCPEGGGVNVTETLALAGVTLEWPPLSVVRQVAIADSSIKVY